MGGLGALRIGAKYGSQFSGISGHSSMTSLEQMKLFVEEDLETYRQQDPVDEDVLFTIQQYRDHLPPIRFDCGTGDQLITYNRELHRQLQQQDIAHVYEEYAGAHEWAYWEKYIGESLRFFARQLK
jgi:putative tributyrin esterase